MTVHANSVAVYHERVARLTKRAATVLDWYTRHGKPATDRECMNALGFPEPNYVRPRITELIDAQILEECGRTQCPVTFATVRLVRLPQPKTQKPVSQRLL